jgi:hypothetical protein
MASIPTPTQQRNSFSEGFALGLILNGKRTLVHAKSTIDLSVVSAFRKWSYAAAFPQVGSDLRGLDGIHALARADERKRTFAFYWDRSGPDLRIVSRDPDWSEENPDDVSYAAGVISDLVPPAGWQTLAATFLANLDG